MVFGLGDASVSIIIRAVDKFSKVFSRANLSFKNFKKAGLAAGVVGGVIAFGLGKAIKTAVDAQETFTKFETVFEKAGAEANAVAQDLVENFGLSSVAAKQLLGDTGDLLTGLGFTDQAALDLAESANKLAVDLASFTNVQGGAERAGKALTKAMLGEREMLKELGISVLETDVKNLLLERGQERLTGIALKQAKAVAVLDLAIEQSPKAIGDFARTQEGAANQIKITMARFEDLAVEIGNVFIPILEKILPLIQKVIVFFSNLSPATKKIIVIFAAVTAAVFLLAGAIALMTFVSLPWLAIIFGIAVAITAIIAIIMNWGTIMDWIKGKVLDISIKLIMAWEKVKDGFTIAFEVMKNVSFKIWNSIVDNIQNKVNLMIKIVNTMIKGLNRIPKVKIPLIPEVDFGSVKKKLSDITALRTKLSDERQTLQTALIAEAAAIRGTTIEVNIDTINGTDPDDIATALQNKLKTMIST